MGLIVRSCLKKIKQASKTATAAATKTEEKEEVCGGVNENGEKLRGERREGWLLDSFILSGVHSSQNLFLCACLCLLVGFEAGCHVSQAGFKLPV